MRDEGSEFEGKTTLKAGFGRLTWFLRILGCVDLLALGIVALPTRWIDAVNRAAGLEDVGDSRLSGYLVRSTSALYALHGALLLFMSFDAARFLPVIRFLGWLAIVHGAILVFIDTSVGMPWWWCAVEGPVFALCGAAVLRMSGP
jgi:hypothetical protein